MATITRVRDDEIQAGKVGRAGDVSAELDNIIGAFNVNDGRIETNENEIDTLQGELSSTQGDVSTLQTEMNSAESRITTNEGDILVLQGASLTPQDVETGSFTLLRSFGGLVVMNASGFRPTCNLPEPDNAGGFSPANRWLIVCRSLEGAIVQSNYFGPATVGKEILLLDGDACMVTVMDDPVLSTRRWNAVVLRADVRRFDWYQMSAGEVVNVNPNQYLNFVASNGGTVNLPPIDGQDEMIGLEVTVHNLFSNFVDVNVNNGSTEDIIGNGTFEGNTKSLSGYRSITFRAGPNGNWFILGGS